MHKTRCVLVAALFGMACAPVSVHAQTYRTSLTDLTPFTRVTSYMSLYGYLRLRSTQQGSGSRARLLAVFEATYGTRKEFERKVKLGLTGPKHE
jgi:hypothetical protein